MKFNNILVTGGCGFIGSHFVDLLLRSYPTLKVVNVDVMSYAAHPDTATYLESIHPSRYRFYQCDIGSAAIAEIIEANHIDAVVNFAAESHVDRSILSPMEFINTNVVGVQNLLSICRKAGISRFVQVSTDEVYGSLEPGDAPFTELSPLHANSPYAASKASADLIALANQRTFKQDIVITRCSNNYGPFQFPEKLIPLVIANAMEEKSIPVYGDGKQVRDWIYVGDHCRGIATVLEKGVSGEVYNLSATHEQYNIDVIRTILNTLGKPLSLISYVGDRPAHDRRYALSSEKVAKALGWNPEVCFEQGIAKTVEWYLANQDWWKKIRGQEYQQYYAANYASKQSLSPSL